ncbi:MAG: response regulator [Deferrisomatales bacterium]
MKALVIDDSSTLRQIIRHTLEIGLGFTVAEAEDVGHALDVLHRDGPFQLVVTDLNMPGLSGLSLVRRLGAGGQGEGARVLVVSVEGHERRVADEALAAGASGFLAKPFRREELVAAVRGVLAPPAAVA